MGGINIWQVLIVLVIVILLFGTSKLKNVGNDLGSALKGFKKAIKEDEKDEGNSASTQDADFEPLDKPAAKNDASGSVSSDDKSAQKQTSKD